MDLQGKIIAIDFDGTCVTHEFPEVGEDIGAAPVIRRLVDRGAMIILWTMRSGEYLTPAVEWFSERGIPLHGVNTNPGQFTWTQSPKAFAHIYIDDAALGAPLIFPEGERPYINWEEVETILDNL